MKPLRLAGVFRRDLRRITRRGYRLEDLEAIVTSIRRGERLAASNRAHPLKGEWRGYWECHVAPDWLLIYKLTEEEVLLARTGTHADLFDL
jgi:mRNA interferase YafQ